MEWGKILLVILAAVLAWLTYKSIRANPEALTKQNLSKSFSTMGMLAIILIIFIGLCVYLLRAG